MGRKIIILGGVLASMAFLVGVVLDRYHSRFADFVLFLCFPFVTLVFLILLFAVPLRSISAGLRRQEIVRWIRVVALLGAACLLVAVFWPRSYGGHARIKRANTRYWNLSTGSRIAYTLIPGKGSKKPYPIIYLLGGPGGAIGDGLIKTVMPIADDGYDIYLYDQIGSGWSNRLENIRDYSADRHKRDLEAIVKMIGARKVILVGQSWGAILAVLFAADDSALVQTMILTGPGPIQPGHPWLAGLASPDSLQLREPFYSNRQGNELASNIRARVMTYVAVHFGWKLASDKEADEFEDFRNRLVDRSTVYDTGRVVPTSFGGGPSGFYAEIMTVRSFPWLADPRPKLGRSTIPVLVMKGQYDNQKWGFTHEYLDLFPRHELVVFPKAGHCISCDQPTSYLETIRGYLKLSARRRG